MSVAAVVVALPAALVATWALLRSPLAARIVATPRGDRWHVKPTPLLGGLAIFAAILAGVGLAVATGGVDSTWELWGILGGCAILFLAGLADDLWDISPITKIGARVRTTGVYSVSERHTGRVSPSGQERPQPILPDSLSRTDRSAISPPP